MKGFHPRQHFDSGQVAKCFKCEAVATSSWPGGWLMFHDGFMCPECSDRAFTEDEASDEASD